MHKNADAARFQKEARAIAALNHPNIVAIFDVGDDYLVTELVDGQSLRARKPTQREALDYAAQIADGLAAAHAAGITHRDLKPDNIMVTRDGRVKILDFGLAQQRTAGPGDQTLTAEGLVMGTVSYMSPEQARAASVDARSDIFAFGATLYELLSGRRAFEEPTAVQTMSAVIEKDPTPLPEDVPSSVKDVVLRCLEKEPVRRFQSAADLAFALRHTGSVAIPKAHAKSFPWLTAALAAALALAIAFIVLRPRAAKVSLADLPRIPVPIEEPQPEDGRFSPDGKSIIYSALVGDTRQIFLRQLDSADSQQITTIPEGANFPFWTPDGAQIYFRSATRWYVQGLSSTTPRALGRFGPGELGVTPDGKGLVGQRLSNNARSIEISQPPGAEPREIRGSPKWTRSGVGFNNARFDFTPSGRQFLFSMGRGVSGAKLFVVPWPEGSGEAREIGLNEAPGEVHLSGFIGLGDSERAIGSVALSETQRGLSIIDIRTGKREIQLLSDQEKIPDSFDARTDRLLLAERRHNWGAWTYVIDSKKIERAFDTQMSETTPAWSPDGATLAFFADYGNGPEVWLKNLPAGWRKVIFKASSAGGPSARLRSVAFSPDGERLAVSVTLDDPDDIGYRLYLVSPKTGHATQLQVRGATPRRQLDWSPDGRSIAFRELGGKGTLIVVDVESGNATRIADSARSGTSWSRDGKWIANFGADGVFLVSPDGKNVRQVSKRNLLVAADAPNHCFSADGKSLYIIRNQGAYSKIERLDLAADKLEKLAELPGAVASGYNYGMRLHPDGKSLIFTMGESSTSFWIIQGVNAALGR